MSESTSDATSHHSRGDVGEIVRQPLRDRAAALDRAQRAALGLNRDRLGRLAGRARGLDQRLGDHLLAAERDDQHGADVRMAAVGGQRLVRREQVRTELAAAGQMRQRDDRRRQRFGDALGHDGRADDGGHDQHVVADADAAVRSRIIRESRVRSATRPSSRLVVGLGQPGAGHRPLDRARSPRPRLLATLCVWTCAPAAIGAVASPIGLPYLRIGSPAAIATSATLWPGGMRSATQHLPAADVERCGPRRAPRAPWRRCRDR